MALTLPLAFVGDLEWGALIPSEESVVTTTLKNADLKPTQSAQVNMAKAQAAADQAMSATNDASGGIPVFGQAESANSSPVISPAELAGKTRIEIRDLATQKGLKAAGDSAHPDFPRKWKDPVTSQERLRLDRGHIDPSTGLPYKNPKAAVDHVHGYDGGATKSKWTTILTFQRRENKMTQQIEVSDGEVRLWIEQESLHLQAADSYGDPVELTKEDAIKLAEALVDFAAKIDDHGA